MLSIKNLSSPDYFFRVAQKKYYFKGAEPEGRWHGKGADRLGLTGTVVEKAFRSLFAGFSPGEKALVKNAGDEDRCAGWDLTFSAMKIISLLWVLLPKKYQRIIRKCHGRAVDRAIRYLQDEVVFVRRGKQGKDRLPGEIVCSKFEHASSRLLDPNLHTHVVVFNSAFADGRWSAIDGKRIYNYKMVLGAIYRTELVYLLWKELRLPFKRVKDWVDVDDVLPAPLVQFFSKRSQEIRDLMRAFGSRSAYASDIANQKTRQSKKFVSRHELFRRWRREAKKLGYDRDYFRDLVKDGHFAGKTERSISRRRLSSKLGRAVQRSVDTLASRLSHFPKKALLRQFLPMAAELHVSVDVALEAVERAIKTNPEIVTLTPYKGETRLTTKANLNKEESLLSRANSLHSQAANPVSDRRVNKILAKASELTAGEQDVVKYLVQGPGRIKILSGGPGSGKSNLIGVARKILEDSGCKMIGAAVAGRAARNLEQKSQINSQTLARLSFDLKPRVVNQLAHHGRQLIRAAFGLRTYRLQRAKLTEKTVLVIDEASMLDTAALEEVLTKVVKAGASVILVGDEHQLPPIGAGAPFEALKNRLSYADLTENRRLKHAEDIDALQYIRVGEPKQAFRSYSDRELLHVAEDRNAAIAKLLSDYKANGGVSQPENHMMLPATNEDRQRLNAEAQKLRQEEGAVARVGLTANGEVLAKGDRVMFLENEPTLTVNNGDLGTVLRCNHIDKVLTVQLDSGSTIKVPLKTYDHLTLGYAATVHKFQGSDLDNTYALLGGPMQTQELTVTQLSRHKETCRLYTDKIEAGKNLERLCRQIERPSRECLAIDLVPEAQSLPPTSGPELDNGIPPAMCESLPDIDIYESLNQSQPTDDLLIEEYPPEVAEEISAEMWSEMQRQQAYSEAEAVQPTALGNKISDVDRPVTLSTAKATREPDPNPIPSTSEHPQTIPITSPNAHAIVAAELFTDQSGARSADSDLLPVSIDFPPHSVNGSHPSTEPVHRTAIGPPIQANTGRIDADSLKPSDSPTAIPRSALASNPFQTPVLTVLESGAIVEPHAINAQAPDSSLNTSPSGSATTRPAVAIVDVHQELPGSKQPQAAQSIAIDRDQALLIPVADKEKPNILDTVLQRTAETFLERERRIALQSQEKLGHEHLFNRQIEQDPLRLNPTKVTL